MPAIFISHSSLDPREADDIKASLMRLGFERVFLDFDKVTGIGAGEHWEKRLYEELSRCHAVILVLTPNWLDSKWCFAELTMARALGKIIIPVICKPMSKRLVLPDIQAVDLLDWSKGGLERLEQRLRAIESELARGFTLAPTRPPYPGIHSFEAEDAAIYFGRDEETRLVIERLEARRTLGGARLLLIIAASGSGKSSLLKAGVLPQLSRRRAHWLPLPPIRPEKTPLEALAKAIAHYLGKPEGWADWHRTLMGPQSVDAVVTFVRDARIGDARTATVLLPIDQFEEVFTVAEASESTAFINLLAAALDPVRDLPVIVITTGRADVLQGLLERSALAPLTETISLLPITLDRVPRLVEGPAAVTGLSVETGLAERIMRDVQNPDALPLLAYMLHLLYERCAGNKRLTLDAYSGLGDSRAGLNPVQNSVRLAADQALSVVSPSKQELEALRDAFVPHLVRLRLDDGRRVRQPASLSDLPQEAQRLIRALIEARLLTARTDKGKAIVEVTHEALFEAWPTLARWLEEEQAFLADLALLKSAYQVWKNAPGAERRMALLRGLLLRRASRWMKEYPRRFSGPDLLPIRRLIETSVSAERRQFWRIAVVRALAGVIVLGLVAYWLDRALGDLCHWLTHVRGYVRTTGQERALKPGDPFMECSDERYCPEMVVVPAGEFTMGSPKDEKGRYDDEDPRHVVKIGRRFAVSKFEVTFDQWDICVDTRGCTLPGTGGSSWGRGRQPAINISWADARQYVEWLSKLTGQDYRLLSEAEWEYAARAGTTTSYSFGNDETALGKYAWYAENANEQAHSVGERKANAFGLFDMHGNVWEWVEDCYHDRYEGAPTDGSAWTDGECDRRVIRGGSWNERPQGLRSASRDRISPDFRNLILGFRVGRTLTP
jgi:formylglycine-generating enzyme required for sulfatase activity